MEEIITILIIIFLGYLFIKYILPFLAAGAGIAALIVAACAVAYGAYCGIKNYFSAAISEMNFSNWSWPKDTEPAKRSYFFGPGYSQLAKTIKEAYKKNAYSATVASSAADSIRGDSTGFWGVCRAIASFIFIIFAYVSIYLVGSIICATFSLIHGSVTLAFMLVFYVLFSIMWILDRLYLLKNKIRADCPVCHQPQLIPDFQCPSCGAIHKKLVPGHFGVLYHRCICGSRIPSTFFTGRSKLASFCKTCGTPIVASDVRPIVFQLIGGSKAGKTVFLSAFFHEFKERLRNSGLSVEVDPSFEPYFSDLDLWYQGAECPSTAQLNSQMYPLLIEGQGGVRRQFSIYDIAGEMFDGVTSDGEINQLQFHYCDGLLFLLDPFSSGQLRESRENAGEDLSDFSDIPVEDVVNNFINYLIRTNHKKSNARCNIPLSILIAKSDVKEVRREIGPAKIQSVYNKSPDRYTSEVQARDEICREFLINIGLSAAVENLEIQFTTIHYFPVSAMGHFPDGTEYEPWGIMPPVEWILPTVDKTFSEAVFGQTPVHS